jgi:hypothetical protein
MGKYATFISPDGFLKGGQQLDPFRDWLMQDRHLKLMDVYQYIPFFITLPFRLRLPFDYTKETESPIMRLHKSVSSSPEITSWDWQYTEAEQDESKL